jgi:hypothetical protein
MNRLEYLEWYNTKDVIIMCPIIDFLIHKFAEYNVDMLRNISLSSCADQMKFAMAYKDFNINSDYSQQVETTFKITHTIKKICYQNALKGDEEEYETTRKNITGGLSNVHNRKNLKGIDTIKNIVYENDKINIIDTKNIITHY